MLTALRELFTGGLRPRTGDPDGEVCPSTELAAAVLMLEIALADAERQDEEIDSIRNSLISAFRLSEAEARQLMEIAEKEVEHAVSLYEFTGLLNKTLSLEERVDVVRQLWQVAFADQVVDKYEEYHVRKIADLLYVPHRDYIRAKHEAANSTAG